MSTSGHNIMPFDSYRSGRGNTDDNSENHLYAALTSSENRFGPYSGEVGLVLLAMVDHFKGDANKGDLVRQYQKRIDDIVSIYLEDQA